MCTLSDFANTDGAPPSTHLHDTLLGSSQPIAEIKHMRHARDASMLAPWSSCVHPRLGQGFLNSESRCTLFKAKSCHCECQTNSVCPCLGGPRDVESNETTCVGACDSAFGASTTNDHSGLISTCWRQPSRSPAWRRLYRRMIVEVLRCWTQRWWAKLERAVGSHVRVASSS